MRLKTYTDGGARGNPGPAAIGVVICDEWDTVLYEYADTIGKATNNVAEYCALIAGLELAKRFKAKEVESTVDSELLMNQMTGRYKVKTDHIRQLYKEAKKSESFFETVAYRHMRREAPLIRRADALVNRALDEAKRRY